MNFPYLIRVVGDCNTSGHGYAMRGLISAMEAVGIEPEQIDILPWPIYEGELVNDWFYRQYMCARKRPLFRGSNHVNLMVVHPPELARFWTAGWYNIAAVTWETDRLPKATFKTPEGANRTIVETLNRCEEVWVPSESVKRVFVRDGVEKPVFVIPHALPRELLDRPIKTKPPVVAPELHPYVGPERHRDKSPVCFYYVGSWDDRKNVTGLLRAYFETGWSPADPVELVLHTVPSNRTRGAKEAHAFLSQSCFEELRQALPDPYSAPIVHLLTEPKPYSWICDLHERNHVFITATRGEGFCLPVWEALAIGNMVIATQGAVDGTYTYPVPSEIRPITPMPNVVGYELGQKWYEPKPEELVSAFKHAFDRVQAGDVPIWHDIAQRVRDQVSPAGVGKLVGERLEAARKTMDATGW